MQEGTLTLLLDMAACGSAAAPRSAEEIAREMVGIDRDLDTGAYFAVISSRETDASLCLEDNATEAGAEGSARAAESILARLYDRGRADGAAAALAGQQPIDLAGRIRALIQEYAGRWADAEPRSIERRAATGVMDDLCRALDDVRTGTGRPLTWWIELFRHPSGSMDPTIRAHRSLAADELDAIVRERAPAERT
jgi:hypothetical protein